MRVQLTVGGVANALAIVNGYNPNEVSPAMWNNIKTQYEEKARKLIDILEVEQEVRDEESYNEFVIERQNLRGITAPDF